MVALETIGFGGGNEIGLPVRWLSYRAYDFPTATTLAIIATILCGTSTVSRGDQPAPALSRPTQPGDCGYYANSSGHEVPRPCGDWRSNPGLPPHGATALCRDGTYSYSEHPFAGGTCSHHGGVAKHLL